MNPPESTAPLIELKNIHKSFTLSSGQKIKVLQDIHFNIEEGEILALLGPSGSGKSTCLRILSGLIDPTLGQCYRRGKILQGPNPDVAMVFQTFALLPWLTVAQNIAVGLEPLTLEKSEAEGRIKRAIDLVGLEGFEEAYPRELSGGMKQRVGIARALVMERPVLCLDEPFSALDVLTAEVLRKEVLNLWLSKKTPVKSIVIVTHNIIEAISMGSKVLVMGTNPGTIKLAVKNDLPYPRDEKSGRFKEFVENIHSVITEDIIPDTPDWVPPALLANTIEALPSVQLNEVFGLLDRIHENGGRADGFAIALALKQESTRVLLMARAAELLDFVDTPKNAIVLTNLGAQFVKADINERKLLIRTQLQKLRLIDLLKTKLESSPEHEISSDECHDFIRDWLPNEPAEQIFDTLIQWSRYGELFGYNSTSKTVYLDQPDSPELTPDRQR
jgi:NitT/TauT family transport system ATP-binding protein